LQTKTKKPKNPKTTNKTNKKRSIGSLAFSHIPPEEKRFSCRQPGGCCRAGRVSSI
jgi:hypothetical protein